MAGLYSSINSTVKALGAQSRAIEITGKNLANVNNPDYARQRVLFGDRGTVLTPQGAESLGVEALAVEQVRDALLDRQVMREVSLKAAFEAEQNGYQRAQASLGQSIDRSSSASDATAAGAAGLGGAIDSFFNAFQSFAARPTDDGERQTLLQKAGILTDRFQLADSRLAQVQSDLDAKVTTDVDDVNSLLQSIADLNAQIGRFEMNVPGSAVDLRDQRQAKLEELATKLPIEVRDANSAQVKVVAKDGNGADVVLVDLTSVVAPITFTGTQITAGTSATVLALNGGSIQGALSARDGAIQTLRDDLNKLAKQFVIAVNGAYNPTSAAGGDFFDPAGLTAGTIGVVSTITASTLKASNGGAAGDNTLALAIAQLAHQEYTVSGGDEIEGTFSGFYANTVSKLGQSLAAANARVDNQTNIERLVRSQRDSVSAVSLDEEMADLMKYQRAFQASSRVFTVLDELLDNVVNRLGA